MTAATVLRPTEVVGHDFVTKAGITWRQFDTWTKAGHLKPVGSASPGSGRQRHYPAEELNVARRMRDLLDAGFTLVAAARLARLGEGEHDLTERVSVRITAPGDGPATSG